MRLGRVRAAARALLFHAGKRVLRGRAASLPDWGARPRRVLFLRHDKIGDMIMSTGVIRAIAESHPTVTVDVLASRSNATVLAGLPFVHEILVLPGAEEGAAQRATVRAAWTLRSRRYDAVVDGLVLSQGVSPTTDTLLAVSGAPRRIGMPAAMGRARDGIDVYTHPVDPPPDPDANHMEYLTRLAGPFGIAPAGVPHPTLSLSAAEQDAAEQVWSAAARDQHGPAASGAAGAVRGPRLLVNVSAGHPARRWADDQFVAAVQHVRAARPDVTVLVIGEPGERAAVEGIAREGGATVGATPNVRAAFALVAGADGVLTPDTSTAHAAAAFRKPCVTLMLPGAEPFTPYDTPGEVVLSSIMEMTAVPVAAVTAALDRLIGLMRPGAVTRGDAPSAAPESH